MKTILDPCRLKGLWKHWLVVVLFDIHLCILHASQMRWSCLEWRFFYLKLRKSYLEFKVTVWLQLSCLSDLWWPLKGPNIGCYSNCILLYDIATDCEWEQCKFNLLWYYHLWGICRDLQPVESPPLLNTLQLGVMKTWSKGMKMLYIYYKTHTLFCAVWHKVNPGNLHIIQSFGIKIE